MLDTYSFDSARSRERGLWRFYLKRGGKRGGGAQVRGRVPGRHQGLLAARARPAAGGDGMEREGDLRVVHHEEPLQGGQPGLRARRQGRVTDQPKLLAPPHLLDGPLPPEGLRPAPQLLLVDDGDRKPGPGELAAGARVVLPDAPLEVGGAAGVELARLASQHVDRPAQGARRLACARGEISIPRRAPSGSTLLGLVFFGLWDPFDGLLQLGVEDVEERVADPGVVVDPVVRLTLILRVRATKRSSPTLRCGCSFEAFAIAPRGPLRSWSAIAPLGGASR